jgi:hypothetical protein
VRSYDGGVAASVRGQAAPRAALKVAPSTPASSIPLLGGIEPQSCWLASWKRAIFMCTGPAAEMRYRSEAGLSRGAIGGSDSESLDRASRFVWLMCGRDGIAFTRLAWREACRLMDEPLIWRAVQAVESELFSGLLHLEPADPRPGDSVKFVMPGARAEALIAGAGIALPNILAPHQCGPECIRPSRKTSRRWDAYLAQWAAEGPKDAA